MRRSKRQRSFPPFFIFFTLHKLHSPEGYEATKEMILFIGTQFSNLYT